MKKDLSHFKMDKVLREQPRWQNREILSSPPLMSTQKSQSIAKHLTIKKTWTHQKRYPTSKDIKKNYKTL